MKTENDEDKEKHDASSEQHIQESSTQSSQSVQQPVQQAPQQSQITPTPTQPSRPKPSNKQYLFSQGYDMSSAPSACQNVYYHLDTVAHVHQFRIVMGFI